MSRVVKIPRIGVRYTIGKGVKISWRGGQHTMGTEGQNKMDREVKIPWIWVSIYHG